MSSRLLQTKELANVFRYTGVGCALIGVLGGLAIALEDPRDFEPWIVLGVSLLIGYVFGVRFGRSGAIIRQEGIEVRNPFVRDQVVEWADIASFSIRSLSLFPFVAHIDLKDGRSVHVWGIQDTVWTRSTRTETAELLQLLDRHLEERRSVGERTTSPFSD